MTEEIGAAELAARQLREREANATTYDAWIAQRGWWAEVEIAELMHGLSLRRDEVVWDAGCGTGRLIPFLAPQVAKVIATDYSPASIEVLKAKCLAAPWGSKVEAFAADMAQPCGLSDASVDRIISLQAFQHVDPAGRQVALAEFRRVLRPQGRLTLVVYAYPSWVFSSGTPAEGVLSDTLYFRQWQADEIRQELAEAGLSVERLAPMVCWPQLRRAGSLGKQVEMAAHLGYLPVWRSAYWLVEAKSV
ncbi:MAG: class I SAM-dependent methyltransferase [Candidatus Sericytochromatia bacterium]|nr:class I SAM-dependent methyltransferase [Candidatus Sericytochromatia bacterium]